MNEFSRGSEWRKWDLQIHTPFSHLNNGFGNDWDEYVKILFRKAVEIITKQLDWKASTIGALYKKRWDIELFFKALKQNLQVKTFIGTSENAVKSQIYVALITYLLLELIRRNICKTKQAFSNFCEKIRICLTYYLTLDYICNNLKPIVSRVDYKPPDNNQQDIFRPNRSLF